MAQDRTSGWLIILPLVALIPTAVVPNGSLFSFGLVVLTLIFVKVSRQPTLAFGSTSYGRDVVIGISAGALLWAFSHFLLDPMLEGIFGRIDLDAFAAVKGNIPNYLVLLALGLIYGGIIEELVFRGFVIGWGTALLGERAQLSLLLISTAVFALGHMYQGWSGVISTGFSGLIFALLYLSGGRKLLRPILAHMTLDAIGITNLYLGYAP